MCLERIIKCFNWILKGLHECLNHKLKIYSKRLYVWLNTDQSLNFGDVGTPCLFLLAISGNLICAWLIVLSAGSPINAVTKNLSYNPSVPRQQFNLQVSVFSVFADQKGTGDFLVMKNCSKFCLLLLLSCLSPIRAEGKTTNWNLPNFRFVSTAEFKHALD